MAEEAGAKRPRPGPPPGPAPPPAPENVAIAMQFKEDIYAFHDVTEGSVLCVQDLFTHIGIQTKSQTFAWCV